MVRIRNLVHAFASVVIVTVGMFPIGNRAQATTSTWQPDKAVEFIVPSAAAGSLDLTARILQRLWVENRIITAQSVIANKPGGGHAIAYNYLN